MPGERRSTFWVVALMIVGALALAPRYNLSREIEIGQPQWVSRSARFWRHFQHGDWNRTFVAPHPALPVLWMAGAAQAGSGTSRLVERSVPASRCVAAASVLVLLAACIVLRRALRAGGHPSPTGAALLAGLLLSFDPVLILTTGLVGLDGFFSLLVLLTTLLLILHERTRSRASWIGSLVAGGLATATKGAGLALLFAPFCSRLAPAGPRGRRSWKQNLGLALGLVGAAALAIFILLPEAWVHPVSIYSKLLTGANAGSESLRTVLVRPRSNFLFGEIRSVHGPSLYLVNFVFRVTPLVLLGLLLGPLVKSFRSDPLQRQLAGVAIVFLALISLAQQKEWRYMIPLLAFADVLAALAWIEILRALARRLPRLPRLEPAVAVAPLVLLQALWVWSAHPFYELRLDPLVGGPQAAVSRIQLGWTGGYFEALAELKRQAAHLGRPLRWTGGSHKWATYQPVKTGRGPLIWLGEKSKHGAEDCRVQLSLSDIARDSEPDDWDRRGVLVKRIVHGGLEIARIRCATAADSAPKPAT